MTALMCQLFLLLFFPSVDSPANLHWPPSHRTLTQPWPLYPGPTQQQPLYSSQPMALYQYRHQPPYPTPPHTLNPDPRSGHYQPYSHPIPPRVMYHGTRVECSQPAGKYKIMHSKQATPLSLNHTTHISYHTHLYTDVYM